MFSFILSSIRHISPFSKTESKKQKSFDVCTLISYKQNPFLYMIHSSIPLENSAVNLQSAQNGHEISRNKSVVNYYLFIDKRQMITNHCARWSSRGEDWRWLTGGGLYTSMPMVFLGERPYSGSVGHILLGDARIGGEIQIEGGERMLMDHDGILFLYVVDQPAILDLGSEFLPMILCSWSEYVARRRERWECGMERTPRKTLTVVSLATCRWTV